MKIKQDMMILIMISLSQDGENKMVPNIGLLEILGEVIGVKEEILESLEELTILTFKAIAHGLSQEILGLKTKEIRRKSVQNNQSRRHF